MTYAYNPSTCSQRSVGIEYWPGGMGMYYLKKEEMNMEKFERRTSNWEAGNEAIITGYAVVFDQRTVLYKDSETGIEYGEIIDRHALDGADMSDVVLRYNHQGHVLARTRNNSLQLSIDDHGLNIRADMSGSDEAQKFYKEVKSGLLDKMSFAFQVKEESYDRDTNTRRILAISCLRDVSLVDFPAYDQTQVSARGRFEVFAEPDRTAYRVAQVANVHTEMRNRIEAMGFNENQSPEDYMSPAEYERSAGMMYLCGVPWYRKSVDEADPLRYQILAIRDQMQHERGSADFTRALEQREKLDALEQRLKDVLQRKAEGRRKVAAGTIGCVIEQFEDTEFKEKNMNTESRAFFEKVIETRAAGTTNTMSTMIPASVMDQYVVEKAPGAFLGAAKITAIAHQGNLTLPIATLQAVEQHPENEEIADAGYVPGKITIAHKEYCYKTGYSDLGVQIGAENLEQIIRDTCLFSMLKKMDGICLDAVAALEYTNDVNAVELTDGPSYAAFVKLAGFLGNDFLDSAKWYMNPTTYFNWLAGLIDSNKCPVLDTSKLVSDQAFCGYGIELDSQIPANTVYFGDAGRVHLNYARQPELNAWTDHDHNTQKFSVRTVAGAAAEPGCMVKMYQAG